MRHRSPRLRASAAWAGTSGHPPQAGKAKFRARRRGSLPAAFENSRNSAVITAQTVCRPRSSSEVLQQPSRKKPVSGRSPQAPSGPPRTLRWTPPPLNSSGIMPPYAISSIHACWIASRIFSPQCFGVVVEARQRQYPVHQVDEIDACRINLGMGIRKLDRKIVDVSPLHVSASPLAMLIE